MGMTEFITKKLWQRLEKASKRSRMRNLKELKMILKRIYQISDEAAALHEETALLTENLDCLVCHLGRFVRDEEDNEWEEEEKMREFQMGFAYTPRMRPEWECGC